jgi:hypothetical protein
MESEQNNGDKDYYSINFLWGLGFGKINLKRYDK